MKKDYIMTDEEFLEKEFDFSKAIRNPYAKKLKEGITPIVQISSKKTDTIRKDKEKVVAE